MIIFKARIRITHNRKIGYFTTPFSIKPLALNKKGELLTNVNNNKLKAKLDGRISYYMIRVITLGGMADDMNLQDIITEI